MLRLVPDATQTQRPSESIRADVSRFLYEAFETEEGLLSNVDRWTQRKVTLENLAKLELTDAAHDPVEYCYQNLIREIDSEAQTGIFLVRDASTDPALRLLARDPGVSGELGHAVGQLAPTLFADAFAHSDDQLDLVWVTIRACFERARVDAEVSKIVLGHLMGDPDTAQDMADALRSLLYAFRENDVRQQCEMPPVLDAQRSHELAVMVAQLEIRAGDYADRVREISSRADTQ
jgi:hypothetical protein